MLVYGLDAYAAFEVLRGHSQVYNVKVFTLVASLVTMFSRRCRLDGITRGEVDQMLWDAARSSLIDTPGLTHPHHIGKDLTADDLVMARSGQQRAAGLNSCPTPSRTVSLGWKVDQAGRSSRERCSSLPLPSQLRPLS